MFAVFPFEVVKKISFKKLTDVGGCMGRRLPPSVGNDGWSYRRGPRHGLWWSKKLINFETVVYFCKMNKKYK
jgi:hypothetical protein